MHSKPLPDNQPVHNDHYEDLAAHLSMNYLCSGNKDVSEGASVIESLEKIRLYLQIGLDL